MLWDVNVHTELILDFRAEVSKRLSWNHFPPWDKWEPSLWEAGPPVLVSVLGVLSPSSALMSREREVNVYLCREDGHRRKKKAALWDMGSERPVGCRGQSWTDSAFSFVLNMSKENDTFI